MLPPNYFLCAFLTESIRRRAQPPARSRAPNEATVLVALLALLPWLHLPPR